MSKTLEKAKVFYTIELMAFDAQVNHSICSSSEPLTSYWHVTKATLNSRIFSTFITGALETSQPVWSLRPNLLDSYYYVSYVLRIPPQLKIIGFDYGYVLVRQPPNANILGASIAVQGDGNITLRGSLSHDPNADGASPLTFTWFCRRSYEAFPEIDPLPIVDVPNGNASTAGGCYGYGPGRLSSVESVLFVNADVMEAGQTYVFELVVSNAKISSKTVHWLTLKGKAFFIR